jgi:hypothetical protein
MCRFLNTRAVVFVLLLVASASSAHHSSAMFDKQVVRHVTASVKEFQWTNPHVWIQIIIDNEEGETEEWSIEGLGPNSLSRKGWRRDSFKAGEIIEIKFNPMRDGSKAGGFVGARFTNGKTIGNW